MRSILCYIWVMIQTFVGLRNINGPPTINGKIVLAWVRISLVQASRVQRHKLSE